MGRDDRLNNLVLRFSDEVEECLRVYWGAIFAENEGRSSARNPQLVWVYWIIVETFCEIGGQRD